MKYYIEFKRKAYEIYDGEVLRKAINLPKKLTRSNCNLVSSDHNYYNTSLFENILMRKFYEIFGEYREWIFIDEHFPNTEINSSSFLTVVRIEVEKNFRW